MIVISNTSPITNLAAIGQLELLQKLFSEVVIAEGVWSELNAYNQQWPGRGEVAQAHWVERKIVNNPTFFQILRRDLDPGEAETIALAIDEKADLVLMDERDGRSTAQRLGLKTVGVVGILLESKKRNLIDLVSPLLSQLRVNAGFYLSNKVVRHALMLAGEDDV